jgi:hypothetical protein
MSEFYVIPTIGTFKIQITPQYVRDSNKLLYTTLSVGGNVDKCVNLTIYPDDSPKRGTIVLSWTEVIDKSCTVSSQVVKGNKTIEMLHLAFTIAKEIAPYIEHVTLNDMSYFLCDTPDGKIKVSLPPYYIAFHNKTWYEDKFKAVMVNETDYEKYKTYIQNMYKEGLMPESLNFGNPQLSDILYPLYKESKTWKSFFNLIEKQYPTDKCTMMYPWINSAMNIIFEGNQLFVGYEWKINLNNIPKIHYYEMNKSHAKKGGNRFNKNYVTQNYNYRDVNYNNTMNWDVITFLKKRRYTTKNNHVRRNTKKNTLYF